MASHPLRLQNGWPNICCGRIWTSTKSCKKPKNLKTYITQIFAPKGGRPLRGRPPFGCEYLQGCEKLSCSLMFLYNAKPSFEIAKWMSRNMLWQNMKINKIMQKPENLKTYISRILAPKEGRPRSGRPLFWFKDWPDVGLFAVICLHDFVDFHILRQHIYGHSFCNIKGWLGIT